MQPAYIPAVFSLASATGSRIPNAQCTSLARRPRLPASHGTRMSASDGSDDIDAPAPLSWREVRAQLYAGSAAAFEAQKSGAYRVGHWAHPISVPETGCFLASHPAFFRRDAPYLTQAVVFLVSYSPADGAKGIVLNRPLNTLATREFSREIQDLIGSQSVYLGGPHGFEGSALIVLHSDAKAASGNHRTHEPLPGVFVAPVETARGARAANVPPPDPNVRVFAGCVSWPPGKLEAEVNIGEWYCVSASERFATSHCIQLAKPLWVEIMESQGEPFSKIARRLYGNDDE